MPRASKGSPAVTPVASMDGDLPCLALPWLVPTLCDACRRPVQVALQGATLAAAPER